MVVGLLGNESPDLNRFILVNPKSENDVRLQATIGNQNPTGLPVGAVRPDHSVLKDHPEILLHDFEGGKYAVYHFKGVPQLLFMVYQEIDICFPLKTK